MIDFGNWPTWGAQLAWTLGTLAASWGIGHVLGAIVMSRVPQWLPGRQQTLVESAVHIVRRRLPWWSLLIGVWLAAGYWPLTAEGHLLVARAVFVVGALSVTLVAAAVASQSVDAYGAMIAPALRVSSLTRNVAWAITAVLRYHTFADSSINFTVILRAREFVDQYLIKHEFVKRLHTRFNDEGIVIPFPIRTIAQRDAAPVTDVGAGKVAGAT